ncbi:MAG: DNA (cytosine-5-)-methyltransferase [Thermoplasmata archaeon]|nr:DNA cytosine methyltransferase [Euryarchaeota archaeon]RLF65262.1 MAG: DNA (cytosine-5-)-methyltransferase [Thermoplasmata archaeon]
MDLRVIDLFSGAGGFSLGFKKQGCKILLGIEIDEFAAKTYAENFTNTIVLVEDIKKVHSKHILDAVGSEIDVVIGGPPCEAYTVANFRRMKNPLDRLYVDPLGQLVLHFIRIVGDLEPKVFVMENVVPIVEGPLKNALIEEFSRIGYEKIYFNVLKAEDFGNPSKRRRMFISNVPLEDFLKKYKRSKPRTVKEALEGLPHPGYGPPNHDPVPISEKKLKKIVTLRWGRGIVYFKGSKGKLMTSWVRLHPDKPAPTVMGKSRFIHPYDDRLLTPREHARIMSYPDDHVFYGPRDSQYNQVGESVPPILSFYIAKAIVEFLNKM